MGLLTSAAGLLSGARGGGAELEQGQSHAHGEMGAHAQANSVAAAANAVNPPLAVITLPAPPSVLAAADARVLRERDMFAYRGGDLSGALAHFNLAIAQDPEFAAAYIDRGIVFYRMRNYDRAFADMAQAKRLARTSKDSKENKDGKDSKAKPVAQAPAS